MAWRKLFGGFRFGLFWNVFWSFLCSLSSGTGHAHALALQPFHHQLRAGVAFVGEFAGLGHQGSELGLDLLRFLECIFLAALHMAQVAPFARAGRRFESRNK